MEKIRYILLLSIWGKLIDLIFLISIVSFDTSAQSQALFKKIDRSNGLSNTSVTCFVQDNLGFVWIGTKNGLNRYDGFDYKIYNKKNSSLSADDITDLLIDNKGRLWIGTTGGGLNRYDQLHDDFVFFKNIVDDSTSLSSNQIIKIFEDSKYNLLIGTENGLNQFEETSSTFKRYLENSNSESANNSVWAIAEDEGHNIWLGSFGGSLMHLDLSTGDYVYYVTNNTINNLSANFIFALQKISGNRLLIGTGGSGLLVFDIDKKQFHPFFEKAQKPYRDISVIRTIYKDSDETIWVGTDGQGVLKIEEEDGEILEIDHFLNNAKFQSSLTGNTIYSIFEDRKKNIWIGSAWNGISILESNSSGLDFYYSDFTGENPLPVLSIYQNENQFWIGSDGLGFSIYDYKTKKATLYHSDLQLPDGGNHFQLIKPSLQGNFWLGTFSNGLLLFDLHDGVVEQHKHDPKDSTSLSYNDVRDVLEDRLGNVWVATWGGGLCHFDKRTRKFRSFKHNKSDLNSISNDNVLSLKAARDGKIWVATFGGGLNLFDPLEEKFQRFLFSETDPNSISGDNVLSLLDDGKGNLWVGTWGDGLCRFDINEEKFEKFDETDGIGDDTVTSLIADNTGNIWMSTKSGISKYDKSTGSFTAFTELLGEFHINSAFKDSYGKLYFGGINGVIAFDPVHIKQEPQKLIIQITDFKLFNKDVKVGEGEILSKHILYKENIVLDYDQTVLTFEFAVLQYPFSDNCEYAILMENFDQDWRELGQNRNATFTNLSPGEYQFKVRAKNIGGEWNDQYASVNITILKPFWTRWWAITFFVLVFLTLLYLFQKYSMSWGNMKNRLKLEQLSREKETEIHSLKQKFFTNISHEIRTPVTLILGSINRINESHFIEKRYQNSLGAIKKNSNHLLQLVNELLDIRKLDAQRVKLNLVRLNFVEYAREIFLSFNSQAIKYKIDYQFQVQEENIPAFIDADQMEKVVYNLLSNAFKFTDEGGTIKMKIWADNQEVCLSIKDSGKGIPKNQLGNIFKRFYQTDNQEKLKEKGYGIGLSIVKDIIQLHEGNIDVQSTYGKGSCFTIKIKRFSKYSIEEKTLSSNEKEQDLVGYLTESDSTIDLDLLSAPGISDTTILIVEDNLDIRKYMEEWLRKRYKILSAGDGKEGLELARRYIPDLVISDVMMPIMDGITFAKEIKSSILTSHIPIIILTARTSLVYKKEGYETGADEYITKPFSEELLIARITGILKNREILREKFNFENTINPKELSISTPDQKFLKDFINIIEENIDEHSLNTDLLTKELGMSRSVVYKKIKALTGQSIVNFVKDFKLKRAAQLIEKYGFSITDACYKVGFSDRKYFTRIFKEKFGKPPSKLIKK